MKIEIDTGNRSLDVVDGAERRKLELYGDEAFELLSRLWMKTGWNQKYPYTFAWMGRPIIQHPEDVIRMQEVIYRLKPDVIIETGVAHGGSLVFYASLMKAMGRGRVVGVDIEIRPHNRQAIETHELAGYITLIEGNSVAPEVVARAGAGIGPGDVVMIVLDSDHTKAHVAAELEAYRRLVSPGSYMVATDGLMEDLWDVPRGKPGWRQDNPAEAAREFAQRHPDFLIEQPSWPFNESQLSRNITAWPSAWLRRIR